MLRRAAALGLGLSLLAFASPSAGFGEEHVSNFDTDEVVSTHHLYLTRALAVCAGYSTNGKPDPFDAPLDAERIAIANQLADSEKLAHRGGGVDLCSAAPYPVPKPEDVGCSSNETPVVVMPFTGVGHVTRWLPLPRFDPTAGCFASRFGPYSNDFHFPDAERVEVVRAWASGESSALAGTERLIFGGALSAPWNASCHATRSGTIDTGDVTPGSLEALGIYTHVIGDRHSHAVCLERWGDRGNPPWPTHVLWPDPPGCSFFDHSRELGCPTDPAHDSLFAPAPDPELVEHAVAAGVEVYDALASRARQQGIAPRLDDSSESREWIASNARRFVTGWSYLGGARERREFANLLASACAALVPGSVPSALDRQPGEVDCTSRAAVR